MTYIKPLIKSKETPDSSLVLLPYSTLYHCPKISVIF